MRKINWDDKLTDEDIVWLRNAGHMSEEQIATHQAQFDADVPDLEAPEDEATRSALSAAPAVTSSKTGDGPLLVDPRAEDPQDGEPDDYDQWSVAELKAEVDARNGLADTSDVEVEGTGKSGAITKSDLIKGLRLWDAENPQTED
jgi:hypothetical protein